MLIVRCNLSKKPDSVTVHCFLTRLRSLVMRAVVFSGVDRPIEIMDVNLAPPEPGEVRVKIAAAGVCHSDLHVRRGEWVVPTPLVMGHEGSGTVVEVGSGVTTLKVGDHVVLS